MFSFIAAVFVFSGCGTQDKEETLTSKKIDYEIPKPWVRESPSDQLKFEQYLLPGLENSEAAELAVFKFPRGEQSDNYAERWLTMLKQTDEDRAENLTVKDSLQVENLKVKIFETEGTYIEERKPVVMGGPKNFNRNYKVILAVIDNENVEWQFRILGPAETLDYWQPAIMSFLNSFTI